MQSDNSDTIFNGICAHLYEVVQTKFTWVKKVIEAFQGRLCMTVSPKTTHIITDLPTYDNVCTLQHWLRQLINSVLEIESVEGQVPFTPYP